MCGESAEPGRGIRAQRPWPDFNLPSLENSLCLRFRVVRETYLKYGGNNPTLLSALLRLRSYQHNNSTESNRMTARLATRPTKAAVSTSLIDGKGLYTAQKPDDAAAGLVVLCALACGFVMFGFYMQTQQKQRSEPATAYLATISETKTRVPNPNDYSRHAGDEIINLPAGAAAKVQRALPGGAAKIRSPFKGGAYPGYAAPQ
jgi:hypothetical protein